MDLSLLPKVEPTLPSPSQYEYRTKLTPHFELPRGLKRSKKSNTVQDSKNELECLGDLSIGFAEKGRKRVIDIEECPIATQVINQTLTQERLRVQSYV